MCKRMQQRIAATTAFGAAAQARPAIEFYLQHYNTKNEQQSVHITHTHCKYKVDNKMHFFELVPKLRAMCVRRVLHVR